MVLRSDITWAGPLACLFARSLSASLSSIMYSVCATHFERYDQQ
jgi:hypothetical protein